MNEFEEDDGRPVQRRLVRRLLAQLAPFRAQVAFAMVVTFGEATLQLAFPYLTKQAIDLGIRHRDAYQLDRIALQYGAALFAGLGLGYLQAQMMQRVGQSFMSNLRSKLFRHLQQLPVSYFDRQPVGRLMTRVTNDVDALNELFTAGVEALAGDLILLVGIMIAMARLNAELLGVTFSVLPLMIVVTMTFRVRVRSVFRTVRTRLARLNAFLNENLMGMSTVQLLGRQQRNHDAFRAINADHRDANLTANRYHAIFFPTMELIAAIALALIVWYGGRQVMWTGITLGTLVAFIQYTQRFFRPLSDLSEKYGIVQQAMASAERIFELLDTPLDGARVDLDRAAPERRRGPARGAHVEFDHVSFAYDGAHFVLEDVSFSITPGERVALVGPTGSGKTTLASLLLRYYEPQRGQIRVDGVPLREWNPESLRQRVGLVLQDVFLFSGTIAGNLRLGDRSLADETLRAAACDVHADPFIHALPGAYDAVVRERGATFSSGQKQLLSFARTLARDPDLLILDEATSSVDTHTERLIQEALQRLMANRTSLVIAHRLSTIQDADRIVVLHHGRVRETGTHAELVANGGLYARLVQLQYLGTPRQAASAAR